MSRLRQIRLASSLMRLALALGAPSACTLAHGGPDVGTETGNPPVIKESLLALVVSVDEVHITGAPGAVSPGGCLIEVVSSFSGKIFRGTAASDGSFDIAVTESVLDTFEVRALQGALSSNVVYVAQGASAVTSSSSDGPSAQTPSPGTDCSSDFDPRLEEGTSRVYWFSQEAQACLPRTGAWAKDGGPNRYNALAACEAACEPAIPICGAGRVEAEVCVAPAASGGCAEFAVACARPCTSSEDCAPDDPVGTTCGRGFCNGVSSL